jgi:hypothetical protein
MAAGCEFEIGAVQIHQLISVAINWRGLQASVKDG